MQTNKRFNVKRMTIIAMLGAVSGVLLAINFPLPFFPPFYKLDVADVPALLGGFYMGPWAGVAITVLKVAIKLIIDGSTSLLVGDFSNLVNTLAFILPATVIYRRIHTKKGAVIALAAATLFSSVVAVFLNAYVMLPLYSAAFGMPMENIIAMGGALNANITSLMTFLWFAVFPFNLLKGALTSLVTFLLYKRTSHILGRFMSEGANPAKQAES